MINKEEVEDRLQAHYKAYCRANDLTPDGELQEAFYQLAMERIEDLIVGGYSLDDSLSQYIEEEATNDIVFLKRRL